LPAQVGVEIVYRHKKASCGATIAEPRPKVITRILPTLTPISRAASRSCAVARIDFPRSVFVRKNQSAAVIISARQKETVHVNESESSIGETGIPEPGPPQPARAASRMAARVSHRATRPGSRRSRAGRAATATSCWPGQSATRSTWRPFHCASAAGGSCGMPPPPRSPTCPKRTPSSCANPARLAGVGRRRQ